MFRRRPFLFAAATMLTLFVAGCGGDDNAAAGSGQETSETTSAPTSVPEDSEAVATMFAAMMIPHHQMGIEMAQMAVEKATTPGVKQVAQTAVESQRAQLPRLQSIAEGGGMEPMPPEEPIDTFDKQEMQELEGLSGAAFDHRWLDSFSSHHMSAIMMADIALPGSDGEAKALAQEIHDGQLKEVSDMNKLRTQLSRR
jgi:uncharacterized protein (DUF305 family)